jgi:uncharacterized protein (DUF433 family)
MSELLVYTAEYVCQLTGLSRGQLRRWERAGLWTASYDDAERRGPYRRLYSLRDVVALRVLALLHAEHRVPLAELPKVANWLARHDEESWDSLELDIVGQRVCLDGDGGADRNRSTTGAAGDVQRVEIRPIVEETRRAVARLRQRPPEDVGRVSQRQDVLGNATVLAGTRIPTAAVWDFHAAGYDTAAILGEYPTLTPADVHAAIAYERGQRERRAG